MSKVSFLQRTAFCLLHCSVAEIRMVSEHHLVWHLNGCGLLKETLCTRLKRMKMRGRIDPLKPMKRARIEEEGNLLNELSITARLKQAIQEQEQTFVRLVDERNSQVRRVEEQARDIQAQLMEAQRKLAEAEAQLKSFRDRNCFTCTATTWDTPPNETRNKVEADPGGCEKDEGKERANGDSNRKPVLVIPGDKLNQDFLPKIHKNASNASNTVESHSGASQSRVSNLAALQVKSESSAALNTPSSGHRGSFSSGKEDLVLRVGGNMAPCFLEVLDHHYFPSQHKRKLRSLCMNSNRCSNQDIATSALDGVINTWRIKDKGEGITLCGSVHCLSTGQKRWPEDVAWHPSGKSIFACYGADAMDDQVSIIDPSADQKVKFLKDKPHGKGLINSLVFLPWENGKFFSTAGCDHAVVIWKEKEAGLWRAETLHRALHSSAVMSAVGMPHKKLIVSVGQDKRIIGFDTEHVREEFRHTLDNKALRMLPNPVDWNLYLVQTGTPGAQLRLFDVRSHRHDLLSFGWRQEATESQSALVHPSWSHNGLYIASGSADPRIHLFDIRYKSKEPSQSITAHQKRVFKAVWHHTFPLLISISSDLNVGLVKLNL
ncbi:hypothetical protein GOP47_0002081 [Adiantum capillus-veneris]|uniref:Uncharacterized protein n=1 Tax=Adiantum capillus-veneris TaxID=13818 RepID=A0A9D4VB10_ADICA|nr:hypothetical protein GOP47_0002081 [Adiantum capillus-veneris]